eukprot:TRINITY_DN7394_c0_g1_i6.p1 TRINITY_DN7394_c0_g1~~TRINITY_DN7394_c0_g1_i6.p1  ORF type:complete len:173 (-),score=14.27 TRINITY_DN7394_c0_g1_i6:266-784(-)
MCARMASCVKRTYDLKGSWVDRFTGASGGTLKDLDLTEPIKLWPQEYQLLLGQLKIDSEWLRDQGIMDYSLLMTVVEEDGTTLTQPHSVAHSCCRSEPVVALPVVCVGMIDALQRFDCGKMGELGFKSLVHCTDRDGVSCMPPGGYQERFIQQIQGRVFSPTSSRSCRAHDQ